VLRHKCVLHEEDGGWLKGIASHVPLHISSGGACKAVLVGADSTMLSANQTALLLAALCINTTAPERTGIL